MFGFGQTDDDVISRGVVFPLFVRKSSERGAPFCYLGNYVASESEPVAWKRLSPEVRFFSLCEGIFQLSPDFHLTRKEGWRWKLSRVYKENVTSKKY